MILYEPTAFMDIPPPKILNDLLTEWMDQSNDRTIIMTSHQVEYIRKLADYLAISKSWKIGRPF